MTTTLAKNTCRFCRSQFAVTQKMAEVYQKELAEAYPSEPPTLKEAINELSVCPKCSGWDESAGSYEVDITDEHRWVTPLKDSSGPDFVLARNRECWLDVGGITLNIHDYGTCCVVEAFPLGVIVSEVEPTNTMTITYPKPSKRSRK